MKRSVCHETQQNHESPASRPVHRHAVGYDLLRRRRGRKLRLPHPVGCAASCNRHRFGPDHQGSLFLSVPGYCCWRRYVCQLQFHGYDHPYLWWWYHRQPVWQLQRRYSDLPGHSGHHGPADEHRRRLRCFR